MSTIKANRYENTASSSGGINIDSSGNVGMGQSSPNALLEVKSGTAGNEVQRIEGNYSASGSVVLSNWRRAGGAVAGAFKYNDATTSMSFGTTTSHSLMFRTGDSDRLTIDSSGRVLIGTSTARANFLNGSVTATHQVEGSGSGSERGNLSVINNSSSDIPGGLFLGRSKGTSVGSNTLTADGDWVGRLSFVGNDGAEFVELARVAGFVDGTSGSNDMPGRLVFSTTANGAASPTDRARISNQGRFDIFASSSTDAHFISSGASAGTSIDLITGKHSATAITNANNGTGCFAVKTNGNVVNTNNSYGAISDIKLKENIVDASSQWDDLKAVQIRNYNFKESTGQPTHTQLGVVAQEIETVSPGLVYETPDRDSEGTDLGTVTKSVNYSVLYMKSVKALQEAMTRIEALEAKVAALEAA